MVMNPVEYAKKVTGILISKGFNRKKVAKVYERKIQSLAPGCRMKKTDLYKQYNDLTKKIIGVFKAILSIPGNVENHNNAIVMYLLDDHIDYLNVMKARLSTVQTIDLIQIGHEAIIEKKDQLLKVLLQNLERPISLQEFQDIMLEGDNRDEYRQDSTSEAGNKSNINDDERNS